MSTPLPYTDWRLDHIGIAVKDLDLSLQWYENTTGMGVSSREKVAGQGVEVAFLGSGPTRLELLAPLGETGPLATFLAKRGPGLHHVCYAVKDIAQELQRLSERGVRLIDTTPRLGAENALVAFIHPSSCGGVLTELVQHPHP
jgi:methylmalonyl-CoA/ethylmalonyl-CoA epimerase